MSPITSSPCRRGRCHRCSTSTGAPEVDLLSLDVEGYEAEVLAGLDLDRHAPRMIVVEVDLRAEAERVQAVLGGRYRPPERLSPVDLLFTRADG